MTQTETPTAKKNLVFFDGFCHLCNASVDWLILRDKKRVLQYSSLQGETAKAILSAADRTSLSTLLVSTCDGQILRESQAVFFLLRQVSSGWKFLLAFSFFPVFLTDFAYRIVARNRYRWFGKSDHCRIPTTEEKSHLLP